MAFAIGFVIMGVLCAAIGGIALFACGIVLKTTFSATWFIVVGIFLTVWYILKFVTFPIRIFLPKGAKS